MNALVATGESAQDWGARFDSISLCLSKGLGAPIGSVLTGSKDFIKEGRRFRKIMGGGMRQAGYLAAAGSYALRHQVDRLEDDHRRAARLGSLLESMLGVESVRPVETNIVIFDIAASRDLSAADAVQALGARGVRVSAFGPRTIRLVTHLGIDDAQVEQAGEALRAVLV